MPAKELEQQCVEITYGVNGALCCAVVDLETGLLLAVHHIVPYFSQTYLDAVAGAAVDLFRGRGVSNVEKLLSSQRGEQVRNSIMEVQMTTTGTYHFMSTMPNNPNVLAVLITDRKANLGAGWAALRNSIVAMAPHCL